MPAPELRIGNRTAYFRKAIKSADFSSDRVLARDGFKYAELWLKRNCAEAVPYWNQAQTYFRASQILPPESSPLTLYYCFLNAAKALLIVKGTSFGDTHGVSGEFIASKRALSNERVLIQEGGVIGALARHLGEGDAEEFSLTDILSNLPFVHRAFRLTYTSHPELFMPLRKVVYRKHPTQNYVWISAEVQGRLGDNRSMRTLPDGFERDDGYTDKCVIRVHRRVRWFGQSDTEDVRSAAFRRLQTYHHNVRRDIVFISASPDLWYLKRKMANSKRIDRYAITLIIAAMHRLSELSRYDPEGLIGYLNGKENWLLTEFIELAPIQFIDELVCEMTSLEFGLPGVRPKAS